MAAPSGPDSGRAPTGSQRLAIAGVAALALLELLWELWLAPLKPGGSWLAVKALPLVVLWPGLARGARKARQGLALLLPFYVAEAIVRALTESGRHGILAATAAAVAGLAFGALLASFRSERHARVSTDANRTR